MLEMDFDKFGTLLLKVNDHLFNELADTFALGGLCFEKKVEFHITIIGKVLGKILIERMLKEPQLKKQITDLIKASNWQSERVNRFFHLYKEKTRINDNDTVEKIHAHSVVQEVKLAGGKEFYQQLATLLNAQLTLPYFHITLYTIGDSRGIGVASKDQLEQYLAQEITIRY